MIGFSVQFNTYSSKSKVNEPDEYKCMLEHKNGYGEIRKVETKIDRATKKRVEDMMDDVLELIREQV